MWLNVNLSATSELQFVCTTLIPASALTPTFKSRTLAMSRSIVMNIQLQAPSNASHKSP
jgi:hypothetical protein